MRNSSWGAAFGNLIGDLLGGMLGPGSAGGFIGNFLLAMALECRSFDPGTPRTWYRELKMGLRDYGVLAGGLLLVGGALLVRIGLSLGAVIPHRL